MKCVVAFLFLGILLAADVNRISLKMKRSGVRTFVETTTRREVFFHGTNAIVKGPPFIPYTANWDQDISLTKKDFAMMDRLGLNVIRLGAMWQGVEPQKGVYNETYLSILRSITQEAAEFGIYTLLDMHQDVLSSYFCGEGIPDWTVTQVDNPAEWGFPAPLHSPVTHFNEYGYPTRQACDQSDWSNYYWTQSAGYAFQSLYDEGDVRDAWGRFWAKVAETFLGASNILGFELINEPWAGDIYAYPTHLIPGEADKTALNPAYDAVNSQIRAVDNETIVFFAAVTYDDIHPAGFTHPPGGPDYSNRSCFAYHWYRPPQTEVGIPLYFETRMEDAKRLMTGAMLTEFDRPNNDTNSDDYVRVCDEADRHLQSHAFWEWKTFCIETNETLNSDSSFAAYGACITGYGSHDFIWNDDGSENVFVQRKLARTYAKAVAGDTVRVEYNWISHEFTLQYEIDTTIVAPTVIFASDDIIYPSGYVVTANPSWSITHYKARPNHLHVIPTKDAYNGLLIEIQISPIPSK